MAVAEAFVALLFLYAAAGMAFALPFLARGIERIDSHARGAGLGFRLIVSPGVIAFWPLLLRRWIAGKPEPPEERNAHRIAAMNGGRP
jgi:hypothetical protein